MYSVTIDHIEYTGVRNGEPFSLVECWRLIEGVGNARIWCGNRLVLDNAGASTTRRYTVRARVKLAREQRLQRRIESYSAMSADVPRGTPVRLNQEAT